MITVPTAKSEVLARVSFEARDIFAEHELISWTGLI